MDLAWRKQRFLGALSKTTNSELLWQVFDWLMENAESEPLLVAEIFDEIIRTQSEQILHFTLTRDVESLLEKLHNLNNTDIDSYITAIVDKLLASNHGDYRKFKR